MTGDRRLGLLFALAGFACAVGDSNAPAWPAASFAEHCVGDRTFLYAGRYAEDSESRLFQPLRGSEVAGVEGAIDSLRRIGEDGSIEPGCFGVELEATCSDRDAGTHPARYWLQVSKVVSSQAISPDSTHCLRALR